MASSKNIRAYRRLTVWLTVYYLGIVGTAISGSLFGFWPPFFAPLVTSSLIAALMLIAICAVIANLKCPTCGKPYFVNRKVRIRLLHARFPLRAGSCRNCNHNAFKAS